MKKKKYYIFTLDMKFLNIFAFVIILLMCGLTILIDKEFLMNSVIYIYDDKRILLTFILLMLYLVLHEILHSIGYYIYGAKYKNIVYGIELEKGIFYCLCKQNIKRKNILNSSMFPLFYIGIVTYIVSFIIKSPYLLILSIFNIGGSVGDIFTFLFMMKMDKNIEFSECDNTTSFGIYSDKDISKGKYIGIKYVDTKDDLERKELTKIKVSKWSYIILGIMLFVSVITLFI